MSKKNRFIIVFAILVIISFFVAFKIFTAEHYIVGVATGHLDALRIMFYDRDTWFVRVTTPGELTLMLETTGETYPLHAKLQVHNSFGNPVETKWTNTTQIVRVTVNEANLLEHKEDGKIVRYLDFKINVLAQMGSGDYRLTVIKPGEHINEEAFSDYAYFSLNIDEDTNPEDINITWNSVFREFNDLSTIKVQIWNENMEEVFALRNGKEVSYYCEADYVKFPPLPDGKYIVSLHQIAREQFPWNLSFKSQALSLLGKNFTKTVIGGKQAHIYQIRLNPAQLKEKYLWVQWGRSLENGKNTMLTAELSKGDQTYQRIVLEANSSFVFSLSGLPAGTYDLKVSGEHSTFALLGVERDSGGEPLDIIEHRIEQHLDARSVMGFVGEPGETVTFVNPDKTAVKVRITKEGGIDPVELTIPPAGLTYVLPAGYEKFLITVIDSQAKVIMTYAGNALAMLDPCEPNNDFASAREITIESTVYSNISTSTDVDYFKVTTTSYGKLFFDLQNIVASDNYDLILYDSAGKKVTESIRPENNNEELAALVEPGEYYVKVTCVQGTSEAYYELICKFEEYVRGKWYSQYTDGVVNWTTTNLDKLYFTKCGQPTENVKKQFMQGCVVCSATMILENLGIRTSKEKHVDVREINLSASSETNPQSPEAKYITFDPFVFMMAFHGWPEVTEETYTDDAGEQHKKLVNATYSWPDHRMIFCDWGKSHLGDEFGYNVMSMSLTDEALAPGIKDLPEDEEEAKKRLNKERAFKIIEMLEKHPEGVIVTAKNGDEGTHSMVYIRSELDSDKVNEKEKELVYGTDTRYSPWDDFFTVYDSATAITAKGDNVKFLKCYSVTKRKNQVGGIPEVTSMIYFEKK